MDILKEFLWALKRNRTYQFTALGIIVALIVISGGILWAVNSDKKPVETVNFNAQNDQIVEDFLDQEQLPRFLDGLQVARGQENYYPVAIMIENLVSTRPQYGLSKAQLVYEALAEGGITRFLAVYTTADNLKEIGPVRSARPYFVDWADELSSMFVHAGGSPEALKQIPSTDIIDLNQIAGDHAFFWRHKDFAAPHNLFTSTQLITLAQRDKQVAEQGTYQPWLFKSETPLEERPIEEKNITIDFSTFSYKVEYHYDRDPNDYRRSNGGEEHKDQATGEQIRVKNIVIQKVQTSLLESGSNRLKMVTSGQGDAIIFRDGRAVEGTWKKNKDNERTRFYDTEAKEIEFNAGSTWVEVVPTDREIVYN